MFSHVVNTKKQDIFSPWFLYKNRNMKFLDLFGRLKSVVIGMIHVKALPGEHRPKGPVTQVFMGKVFSGGRIRLFMIYT